MAITTTTQSISAGVCLSTARPTNPYLGQVIFESDTNIMKVWLGSSWSTGFTHTLTPPTLAVEILLVGGGAGGSNLGGYGAAGGGGAGKVETISYSLPRSTTWTVAISGGGGSNGQGGKSYLLYTPANNFSTYYLQTAQGAATGTRNGGNSGNGFTGGVSTAGGQQGAAGGAGAGANGAGVTSGVVGANGGSGITNNYRTGSNIFYGGGGGGGCGQQTGGPGGSGGAGGGGAGCNFNVGAGSPATANTGGGGGGSTGGSAGGNGGSGISVIRYLTTAASTFTVTGGTKTTVGSYTVHTFLSTGSLVIA
jgi:hypothetical protein